MAPEVISKWLEMLPSGATVLDPMCGSGVVLRQSLAKDFNAVGYDMDPLAVLMSRVWTTVKSLDDLPRLARSIASDARKRRIRHSNLWPLSQCSETLSFVEYWFDEPQRTALARISYSLQLHRNDIPRHLLDGLLLALSKTIITKQAPQQKVLRLATAYCNTPDGSTILQQGQILSMAVNFTLTVITFMAMRMLQMITGVWVYRKMAMPLMNKSQQRDKIFHSILLLSAHKLLKKHINQYWTAPVPFCPNGMR